MKIKLAVLAFALCASIAAQTYWTTPVPTTSIKLENKTATRVVEAPGHYYVVQYVYTVGGYSAMSVPSVMCADGSDCNQAHYWAVITVFEVVNGTRFQTGKERAGQYTEKGCFEDDPLLLVEGALDDASDPNAEDFKKWEAELRKIRAFEAQPLYEIVDGVLRITPHGERDLKAVTVKDKAVWGEVPAKLPSGMIMGVINGDLPVDTSPLSSIITPVAGARSCLKMDVNWNPIEWVDCNLPTRKK